MIYSRFPYGATEQTLIVATVQKKNLIKWGNVLIVPFKNTWDERVYLLCARAMYSILPKQWSSEWPGEVGRLPGSWPMFTHRSLLWRGVITASDGCRWHGYDFRLLLTIMFFIFFLLYLLLFFLWIYFYILIFIHIFFLIIFVFFAVNKLYII